MPATPEQLTEQVTRHQVFFEGLKTHEFNELEKVLTLGQKKILGELASDDVRSWTTRQLKKRLVFFTGLLNDLYNKQIKPELLNRIKEIAVYEAGFEKRSLENVVKCDFEVPSDSQLFAAVKAQPLSVQGADKGKLLESFITDWNERDKKQVVNAIRSGFAIGQTTNDIVRELKKDIFTKNKRDLEMLVRTSLQHAATVAREETFKANSDIINRVRIIATLDSRTTLICQSMDKRTFPINEGPRPPFHVGCRTTFEAVLDERFDFLDKNATRRAKDPETEKQVMIDANESYYSWLKNQPIEFQEEVLGIKRAKLFREGGLSSQRFAELQLNKNFQPLTLKEMERLEPLAFEKAGVEL